MILFLRSYMLQLLKFLLGPIALMKPHQKNDLHQALGIINKLGLPISSRLETARSSKDDGKQPFQIALIGTLKSAVI